MNYDDARKRIKTGDTILVRDAHNWLGRLTQDVTSSPYTHAGMALWLGGRLFIVELNSGRNHLTAMSQLQNFDVYDPPAGLDRAAIEAAAFEWLAKPINYGFAAFIMIGLNEELDLSDFIHWRKIIVCSGGVVQIYEMAGWGEHSRMVSPGKLATMVGPLKLEVRSDPVADFLPAVQ